MEVTVLFYFCYYQSLSLSLIQFIAYIWATLSIEFQGTAKSVITFFDFSYMH